MREVPCGPQHPKLCCSEPQAPLAATPAVPQLQALSSLWEKHKSPHCSDSWAECRWEQLKGSTQRQSRACCGHSLGVREGLCRRSCPTHAPSIPAPAKSQIVPSILHTFNLQIIYFSFGKALQKSCIFFFFCNILTSLLLPNLNRQESHSFCIASLEGDYFLVKRTQRCSVDSEGNKTAFQTL